MEECKNNNLKKIIKLWPMVLLIGAFIFSWAQSQMKNSYQDKELAELKNQQATMIQGINDIKNSVSKIEGFMGKWDGYKK